VRKLFLLLAILLLASTVHAAGGTCPSAAAYLNGNTDTLVTLASLGVTNCYYIAANGADTNTGQDEAHPWLHAPMMTTCASNCLAVQNGPIPPGTGFIFRGGDTWHEGNGALSPYTGGSWNFNATALTKSNGTSSNPIYVGVDKSWFTGASWTRPILNADNPTQANSPGHVGAVMTSGAYVTNCPFTLNNSDVQVAFDARSYFIFDNFEITGLCQYGLKGVNRDVIVSYGSSNHITLINIYLHGWTHLQYNVNNDCGSSNSTSVCNDSSLWAGSGQETMAYTVVDGSDSDPCEMALAFPGYYNAYKNVVRWANAGSYTNLHVFHDNLFEHIFSHCDGFAHSNLLQSTGSGEFIGTDILYNNVFRHICTDSGACPQSLSGLVQQNAPIGFTQYLFGNVYFDVVQTAPIGLGGTAPSGQGNKIYFNNTWQANNAGFLYGCVSNGTSLPFFVANNLNILEGATAVASNCAASETAPPQTEVTFTTNASATAAGYVSSGPFAYYPPSGSAQTVGKGTNHQGYCTTLLGNADPLVQKAGTACQSDTTYAVAYDSVNHVVTGLARTTVARPPSSPWDVGAYQFNPAPPVPVVTLIPTSLSFGSVAIGISSPFQTVFAQNTGNATLVLAASPYSITGPNAADFQAINTPAGQPHVSCIVGSINYNPQDGCGFYIIFTPSILGAETATVSLFDNASGSPQTFTVTGTGTDITRATLGCTVLAFTQGTIGTASPQQICTVTNTGGQALFLDSVTLTGSTQFSFVTPGSGVDCNLLASVAPAGSCNIAVVYTPNGTGPVQAVVTITDNANPPTQTFNLVGGVPSPPTGLFAKEIQ
jgi:hypothetical protein